ncbi:hypothetical protein [Paenibacillus sp. FSL L8-0708]|uniref:hypothetical protein n=1 Tax=Paenibacillus sp. FSL L8-0708 TaxID=2975311 RepID=UPI0030F90766
MKFSKLREMEKLSKGYPLKMGQYVAAKREYDETVAVMFTKDSPFQFVGSPNEGYVKDAEAHAAQTGDADDIARAAILRDRYEAYEEDKTAHTDLRTTKDRLRDKLQRGEAMTPSDVRNAWRVAKLNSTVANVALFSQVKYEQQNPSERPPAPEVVKVTVEDVEAARAAAQANPSAQNIARFSTAKREYAAQTEVGDAE